MATTTKKGSKNKKAKPRAASPAESVAKLLRANKALKRERDEAREQQAATAIENVRLFEDFIATQLHREPSADKLCNRRRSASRCRFPRS